MEPVTHMLTGACLARAGLNRRAAYTTLAMVVAAEFPDIDTLWGLRGPVESFQHHRGITHTFVGIPVEAALIVGAIYGLHRWRQARAARQVPARAEGDHERMARPLTSAPVRWGLLYGFALLALLSHLLLDFTNNYGVRPFFPFDRHWYAASIVFIFDPLLFLLLLLALVAPWLFGLIGAEVGAKREAFRGRGWAIAALIGVALLWTLRLTQHARAVQLAMTQSMAAPIQPDANSAPQETPALTYLSPQRSFVSADPFSPFHCYAATDFGVSYQLADVDTLNGAVAVSDETLPKVPQTAAIRAAENSKLGHAYLDWSTMPVLAESLPRNAEEAIAAGDPDAEPGDTIVSFRDTRFLQMNPLISPSGRAPLTGIVTLDAQGRVIRQRMDGKAER